MTATPAAANYLGELTISAAFDALCPLGEFIAVTNQDGILWKAGFIADFLLSIRSGHWVIHDADHMVFEGFTPEKAASQFAGFTGEQLHALLSGYVRQAQHQLESAHPGFTARFLQALLPAPTPAPLPAQATVFDFAQVLQACGATLQCPNGTAQLVLARPAAPAAPVTDTQVLLASVVVFVAELDLTSWLARVAACHPANEAAQLLGGLARGELNAPAWDGIIPQLLGRLRRQPSLHGRIERFGPWSLARNLFSVVYAQPNQLKEIEEKRSAFRFLRAALDQLPPHAPVTRGDILLAVCDGLDLLARTADVQGQAQASLRLAQASQIAGQLLPPLVSPAQAETWLARLAGREASYSWFKRAAAQSLELEMTGPFAGYVGSAELTVRVFCRQVAAWLRQGRVSNQLWSAAWQVLNQLRSALRNCYAHSPQGMMSEPQWPSRVLMLKNLLACYIEAMRMLLDMVIASKGHSMWFRNGSKELTIQQVVDQEIKLALAAHQALAAHGYGPEATQCLSELVAVLEK